MTALISTESEIDPRFPDSDGQPMADNTEQFDWIVKIKENLEILFAERSDVFVAGDLLWYPVESTAVKPQAPDAMVVFGRPKGRRGSYQQWKEAGVAPQVAFEILSPSNTKTRLKRKFEFYQRYGIEEYYVYQPNREKPAKSRLSGWLRRDDTLQEIAAIDGWVSPRLGIRFAKPAGQELQLYRPDGRPFWSTVELNRQFERERQRADLTQQEAERERQRADRAQQEAEQERQRLRNLTQKLQALSPEQLRELGIDRDRLHE